MSLLLLKKSVFLLYINSNLLGSLILFHLKKIQKEKKKCKNKKEMRV